VRNELHLDWSLSIAICSAVAMAGAIAIGSAAAQGQSTDILIRGVVRSVQQATISTNEPLLAIKVGVRDGEYFKRGDVLVAFDCERQSAERGAAKAAMREAELNLETSKTLDRFRAIGKNDVRVAEQRRDRATFELAALDSRLRDCKLEAPFDGRVAEISVRPFERTIAQRPYITIVSAAELEIESIVPSSLLAELTIGGRFEFRIDELGGLAVEAKVKSIGAAVDPVSKTAKVLGEFEPAVDGILTGMSGTILFKKGR
jgi:membrane fusion protein, multidrug efflux system